MSLFLPVTGCGRTAAALVGALELILTCSGEQEFPSSAAPLDQVVSWSIALVRVRIGT
ncbi:hypothetical protein ACWC4A_46310 [Streptomyces mirabilis]|uniref:hypothetical protein n=1 Tax=Streptomyces sp. S1A1-7 TaxID=2594459 RepID=UPI0013DE8E05|nr:hypothetical protein [Streptomyces sp. S1A1-7]